MQEIPAAKVDLYLFNLINGYAKKSRILDFFAVCFAEYAGYALVVILLLYAAITAHWQIFFISLLAGLAARFIINEVIYFFYKRKRPMEVLLINSLIKKPNHPSFPSGHASFFFGISLALLLFNAPSAVVFLAVSGFIGLARVFCGVPLSSDILAGIVVGFVPFLLILSLIK